MATLHVDHHFSGPAIIVKAAGDVDLTTAQLLDDHLTAAATLADPPAPVVADLREVMFFGSNGVSVLLRAHQRCQRHHTPLHVLADRPVTRPLAVLGLRQTFLLCPTLTAALNR
ncbi:hypothetical protein BLA60_11660 [Actinophytocola xinjiangensis]|uniref:STAS domain-containing protein n=1 Tax=Actinophytocola xinjiangensis TaxID=485602 RepID=A0A7Z1AYE3_9PSEU|nr:STAS domain-containing protein [Actinophytocola xinjiangensis]OLF11596.1 hypothetical protein BLA60_11660 [Actinophytocola xinjiangensis]